MRLGVLALAFSSTTALATTISLGTAKGALVPDEEPPEKHDLEEWEYPMFDEDALDDCEGDAFDRSLNAVQRRKLVHTFMSGNPRALKEAKAAIDACGVAESVTLMSATNEKYVWHVQQFAESIPGLPCVVTIVPEKLTVDTTKYDKVHPLVIDGVSNWKPDAFWCVRFDSGSQAGWRFASILKMGGLALLLEAGANTFMVDADWRMKAKENATEAKTLFTRLATSDYDVVSTPDSLLLNIGLTWVRSTDATKHMMKFVSNRSYSAWDQAVFNNELLEAGDAVSCCAAGHWRKPDPTRPQELNYPLQTYFERSAIQDEHEFNVTEHPECADLGTLGACTVPPPDNDYSHVELFPLLTGDGQNWRPQHYVPDAVRGYQFYAKGYACQAEKENERAAQQHNPDGFIAVFNKTKQECRVHPCISQVCKEGLFTGLNVHVR